jgi:hypothetical protein
LHIAELEKVVGQQETNNARDLARIAELEVRASPRDISQILFVVAVVVIVVVVVVVIPFLTDEEHMASGLGTDGGEDQREVQGAHAQDQVSG